MVEELEGSVDIYVDRSMRVDRLFQHHRRDVWVKNSEIRLADVDSTPDGQKPGQRPIRHGLVTDTSGSAKIFAPVHECF